MALQHLRESVRRNAYVVLGARHLELGNYSEAIEILEWLGARRPRWGIVHRHLASAYRAVGRTADAIAAAERAVAVEPENIANRKILADLYAQLGRVDDALREYRAASRIDPGDAHVQRQLALLSGR